MYCSDHMSTFVMSCDDDMMINKKTTRWCKSKFDISEFSVYLHHVNLISIL